MEWNRVKTGLIVFLLIVNLVLAGGIYFRVRERNRADEQGVREAVELLRRQGVEADAEALLRLPRVSYAREYARDTGREARIAARLLGASSEKTVEGDIERYVSDRGEAVFRSDGYFSLSLTDAPLEGRDDPERYFSRLLEEAGVSLRRAEWAQAGEETLFTQLTGEGEPILHRPVAALFSGGDAQISGQWIFASSSRRGESSLSRGELTFILGRALQERGLDRLDGVELVYALTAVTGGLRLVPVWQAAGGDEVLRVNALTGQLMP